ncbi:hypothetical protein QAD02_011445 [Eretmocerus hayati]|uniref:Uncharacterized protein n=1 Tax=Eretmocerus hayati TaxID=131215 RepID=A0ACC2NX83_9HYME|nr:hypothetical protein QAD02_011445 [Eretmocerus hayati]
MCRNVSRRKMAFLTMYAILTREMEESEEESVDGCQKSFDNRGFSLLHIDAFNEDFSDIESLTKKVSDLHAAIPVQNTPWDGYTALHFVMEYGWEFDAKLLIEKGMDILCQVTNGDTPLHLLMNQPWPNGLTLDLSGLIGYGQNLFGTNGYSFFHVACVVGHLESIKYYLDIGVDPNLRTKMKGHDFNDKTSLHLIAGRYNVNSLLFYKVAKLLVEKGANVNAKDAEMNTPLHCVTGHSNPEIIDLLISYGAEVNAQNLFKETPLLKLVAKFPENQSPSYAEKLRDKVISFLNNGADINLENELSEAIVKYIQNNSRLLPLLAVPIGKHISKMKSLGFTVSQTNDTACARILNRLPGPNHPDINFDMNSYIDECSKEIELMTQIRLDKCTILRDIMSKDLNELAVISENDDFQRIVNAQDFVKKFPIFSPMLTSRLRTGKARRSLLKRAEESFNSLISYSLPTECIEMIFKPLNNHNLGNIILAKARH